MEFPILAIWLIWFTRAYQDDIKIKNKLVLAIMALAAAGLFFGVSYGITYGLTYLLKKAGVVIFRPVLGVLLSVILVGLSIYDYKYGDESDGSNEE